MKKKLLAILALTCGTACFCGLTACGDEHEHTFSDRWSTDESGHWHAATCEHTDEKSDIGAHVDSDKDEKCDDCGYEMHVHKFSEDWESDGVNHWHPAVCDHENQKDGIAKHVDADNDGKCDVCKYSPIDVTVGGTYYYCENDETDTELYIVLKNGKWTDDEGTGGEYTVSGNTLTLFTTVNNEKIEFTDGIVKGNDVTLNMLGADVVYRKGADIDPNKPKDKTLSFALSSDSSYYIVKGIGGLSGNIEIPAEWKKKPVKEIAENAFANSKELTGVVIGGNVEKIGKKAFYNCANLSAATLGEKVNAIAENTFEKCAKLAEITVPASVKRIGEDSFKSCNALTDIYYTGTASDWAMIDFYCLFGSYSSKISNPLYSGSASRNLYIDGDLLTDAELTDAEYISPSAFYGYALLKSVKIGGTVKNIGERAFGNCRELTTLTIENGLRGIGKGAFNSCRKLTAVNVPDSVARISEAAFGNCEGLTAAAIGNGVTYIAESAFSACEKLNGLTLGSSVAEICDYAFYSCNALESVTIPASAIFIGKEAFSYTSLKSATFENTSGWVANKDDALTSAQLEDKANAAKLLISSILDNGYVEAEWEKPTLQYTLSSDKTYYILNNVGTVTRTELVIPEKYKEKPVRALANNAFENCKSLKSISLPGCMKSIPVSAFGGCTALESIEIRGYLVSDYEEVYASSDGILYNASYSKILYIPLAKSEITISGSSIEENAFKNNEKLKKVIIANGVKSIGANAFASCPNLTSVVIPDSVTDIYGFAFANCTNLTRLVIGNGISFIANGAFYNCPNLQYNGYNNALYLGNDGNPYAVLVSAKDKTITYCAVSDGTRIIYESAFYNCTELKKITMQSGIVTIGRNAFMNCSTLTGVYMQSGVVTIGESAFYACNNLKTVIIPDSVVSIDFDAFNGCNALQYNEYEDWCYLGNSNNPYVALIKPKPNSGGTECKIHENTTVIAENAFSHRQNIIILTLPSGITSLTNIPFIDLSKLESIEVDGDNPLFTSLDGILYNKELTEIIHVPRAIKGEIVLPETVVLVSGFSNRIYITGVILPENMTDIASSAFSGCTALESIVIPDGVTSIGSSAFSGCTALESIVIPDGVTAIASSAFKGCTALESAVIHNGVTSIGSYAFEGCTALGSIVIPESVTNIGSYAFNGCSALDEVHISDTDKWCKISLGFNSFSNQYNLYENGRPVKNITLPDGTTEIQQNAFANCKSIISVNIPDSVTKIGQRAFFNCTGLKTAVVPNSVTSLGSAMLGGCTSLESVTLPFVNIFGSLFGASSYKYNEEYVPEALKTVTVTGGKSIAEYAFYGCSHLTAVTIPDSVTQIGKAAFQKCSSLEYLTVPFAGASVYDTNNSYFGYIFGADSYNFQTNLIPDTLNLTVTGGTLTERAFMGCKLESITLGNGITSLPDSAFFECRLTSLIISDSVIHVSEWALSNCSYENLNLPANVLTIVYGKSLFLSRLKTLTFTSGEVKGYHSIDGNPTCGLSSCSSLTTVIIKSGVTGIGDRVFDGRASIKDLIMENGLKSIGEYTFRACTSLTEVIIPDSVASIGHCAFWDCSGITSISFGKGLTTLDYGAFMGCTALTDITYNGTKAQWNAIKKDRSWDLNTGKYTVHCTDGNITKK